MKSNLFIVPMLALLTCCITSDISVTAAPSKPDRSNKTPTIVPIPLGNVNAYLIREDRSILIDTGIPGDGPKLLKAFKAAGVEPADLSLIVITHGHTDHYGGISAIRPLTQAKVAVHRADAGFLRRGVNAPLTPNGLMGWIGRAVIGNPKIPPIDPEIVFDRQIDLKPYGVDGTVIPTPGHTAGSVSVILRHGPAIVGDLIMPRNFSGKTPVYPYYIVNRHHVAESIQKILDRRPSIVYTGHGGPFTVDRIQKVRN